MIILKLFGTFLGTFRCLMIFFAHFALGVGPILYVPGFWLRGTIEFIQNDDHGYYFEDCQNTLRLKPSFILRLSGS